MRAFVLELFLSFGVSTLGILIGALLFFSHGGPGSEKNIRDALAPESERLADFALERYGEQGGSGLDKLGSSFIMTNEAGILLCKAILGAQRQKVADSLCVPDNVAARKISNFWMQVRAIGGKPGKTWMPAQGLIYIHRLWLLYLSKSAFPTSIVVTFLFAFIFIRLVRYLSLAFQRFAVAIWPLGFPWLPTAGEESQEQIFEACCSIPITWSNA